MHHHMYDFTHHHLLVPKFFNDVSSFVSLILHRFIREGLYETVVSCYLYSFPIRKYQIKFFEKLNIILEKLNA